MKINLNRDFLKLNPYQQNNQKRIEKPMTYDVENPGPDLEQAHIVWLWFRLVVFKATFNNKSVIS